MNWFSRAAFCVVLGWRSIGGEEKNDEQNPYFNQSRIGAAIL
ncbi:hypothetical protein [Pontibacter anaerobius]|uniref:Uncharacterized protein n=1 Tax=Pontibacter anaerobius TaxID=2993940 RepID=A0ABT3RGY1_9BACT|nr:hypothetical protein [Pontibacter anaerobius]MCX2740884.1 hypothetical protein [Pontibacter anaerobius]